MTSTGTFDPNMPHIVVAMLAVWFIIGMLMTFKTRSCLRAFAWGTKSFSDTKIWVFRVLGTVNALGALYYFLEAIVHWKG